MLVSILKARNGLSRLIKSVQRGEEVVIANRGAPVARLVAVAPRPVDTEAGAGESGGLLDWLTRHPLPAYARRTHEEIEAGIGSERSAWD